jgi:hypothetical protein
LPIVHCPVLVLRKTLRNLSNGLPSYFNTREFLESFDASLRITLGFTCIRIPTYTEHQAIEIFHTSLSILKQRSASSFKWKEVILKTRELGVAIRMRSAVCCKTQTFADKVFAYMLSSALVIRNTG